MRSGKPRVVKRSAYIGLGDLRRGESIKVALEVTLPSHKHGIARVAQGRIESVSIQTDAAVSAIGIPEVVVEFSNGTQPQRNIQMRNVASEIQAITARK